MGVQQDNGQSAATWMTEWAKDLLVPVRSVRELTLEQENRIVERANEAIERFRNDWDEYYDREHARLVRVIGYLNRALAAILAEQWTFDPDGIEPFRDEESALRWLEGNGDDSHAGEPRDWLEDSNDWTLRSLWEVRKRMDEDIDTLNGTEKGYWVVHWSHPPPKLARSLPKRVQECIHNLAKLWHDQVDPQMGLPRKDRNPDNPLLRFVDAGLSVAMGEQRPRKETVLNYVRYYTKPAIEMEDRDEAELNRAGLIGGSNS